ncbi:hypothetical protein [Brevundimonas sp.]
MNLADRVRIAAVAVLSVSGLALAGCGDSGGIDEAQAAVVDASGVQNRGRQLPPEVGPWIQKVREECLANGARFEGIRDFVLPADFNADGREDYVLMWGGASCVDSGGSASGGFGWGRAGPTNDFLISTPNGYVIQEGFMSELGRDNIKRRGDRDVIEIEGGWNMDGGEVVRVVHSWDGSQMQILERFNSAGQSVDGDGYVIQAVAKGQAGDTLPFREGHYIEASGSCARIEADMLETREITATKFISNNLADSDVCRVRSKSVSGSTATLNIECLQSCGNGGEEGDVCPEIYDSRYTLTIRAASQTRITLRSGSEAYWNGDYTWCPREALPDWMRE